MSIKKIQFEGYELWGVLRKNQYRIYVKNLNTGEKCSFRYWNSFKLTYPWYYCCFAKNNADTVYRPIKTNYDLVDALDCFISDAILATCSFEEFCSELGYDLYNEYCDGYNMKAKKIYNACQRSYKSAIRVFGDIDEVYRVGNKTRDLQNGDYELDEQEIA